MQKPKTILIAVFDGFQLLDATGPAQVFATANAVDGRARYEVHMVASRAGLVVSSGGVKLQACAWTGLRPHTTIVAGGEEAAVTAAVGDGDLRRWIRAQSKSASRLASVCSGAFLLAAAGVLNGRRAATHWAGAKRLAELFPHVDVDPQAIYVRDGKIWTSAGVSTGIDMALAMVAEDCGRRLASRVANQLVVYMHRPGHQSQFSSMLALQSAEDKRLQRLAIWAENRLHKPLDTFDLAAEAGMSLRNFHRHMKSEMKTTPKKWIEDLRLTRARALLEDTAQDLAAIARVVGFTGPDHLIKTFDRRLGLTPGAYRRLHGANAKSDRNRALENRGAAD